ncbi:CotY/CotZ family spore coat protein [Sporosarcina sp. CAU 1771]
MENNRCICQSMKRLQEEQELLSWKDVDFQFICHAKKMDTIPFMIFNNKCTDPFVARYKCIETTYFRLESILGNTCCAQLSLLEALDIEGNPADFCDDIYTLRKTKGCIIVNLNCFCAINPLPPELVNRPLPIIEPKW